MNDYCSLEPFFAFSMTVVGFLGMFTIFLIVFVKDLPFFVINNNILLVVLNDLLTKPL